MPEKLRAAVNKKAYLVMAGLLISAMALIALSGSVQQDAATGLEKRMETILGSVEGAGSVRVLIHEEKESAEPAWNISAEETQGEIIGVLIVAEGAGDPKVAARLAQAAGTVLDVDQGRIEIFCMDKNR